MRPRKSAGKRGRVDEPEERAFGIGVRQDTQGAHLLAVRHDDPDGAIAPDVDAGDLGIGADLGARLARGVGHQRRHRAHAAPHEPPPDPAAGSSGRGFVQQPVRGPGGAGARQRVADRLPAQRRLQHLVLEVLVEVLAGRRREQERHLVEFAAVAKREQPELGHPGQVARSPTDRIGCRHVEHRQQGLRDPAERRFEPRERARVGHRPGADRLHRGGRVRIEHERRTVGIHVQRGPRLVHDEAALAQAEVAPDRVAQHRQHVGARGRPEPGRELLGDARPTHDGSPLEHHGPQSGARQVERGHEAVVTAPDDRDVVGLGHR